MKRRAGKIGAELEVLEGSEKNAEERQ